MGLSLVALMAGCSSSTASSSTATTEATPITPAQGRCATKLAGLIFDSLNGGEGSAIFTSEYGVGSTLIGPLETAAAATKDERVEHGLTAGIGVTQYAVTHLCAVPATLDEALHLKPGDDDYVPPT